jgi:hypothetical protein
MAVVNIDGNCTFCGSVRMVGKLKWVPCAWHAGLDVGHNQPLEARNDDTGECDRAIVIWASQLGFLWQWDDGDLLEESEDYSPGQGQFEDVREDGRQLVSAHSEDTARDAIWAGGFENIQLF